MTPLVELSRQAYPAHRDPGTAVWLTRLVRGLSSVQIYVGDEQFAAGSQLTLADCELAPAPNIFKRPRLPNATFVADARKARCVLAEVRWRFRQQILDVAKA